MFFIGGLLHCNKMPPLAILAINLKGAPPVDTFFWDQTDYPVAGRRAFFHRPKMGLK